MVEPKRSERGDGICLGKEDIGLGRIAGPVAAFAVKRDSPKPHAGGGNVLVLRLRPTISLAQLEQGAIGEAAIAVPLRRRDQPR